MSFRSYLTLMILTTIVAWISWIVVVHGVDPSRSGMLGFVLFYTTAIFSIFGSIACVGLVFRLWRSKEQPASRLVLHSFRQSILLTGVSIGSVLLFSQGWLRWWTALLVVLIATLIEITFVSSRRS